MTNDNDNQNCDPCKWLQPVTQLAKEAGRSILEIYDSGFNVEQKDDKTPLTEADLAAHNIIESGLRKLTPNLPVMTEESAKVPFKERCTWKRYWLVDPLDGTREFIKRNGEFSVNISLIDNHEPVLGVVYAPVLGNIYYACRGLGAFKREATSEPLPIRAHNYTGGQVTVASSRSHPGPLLQRFLNNIGDYISTPMGSALKACLVAEGEVDIYPRLGPTSEWDTAAAQCIVEEAGGQLTDTRMQPLRYNTKESLLNPHFLVFGDTEEDWSKYL